MKTWVLALAFCVLAVPAFAQVPPIVNPNGVEFDPSAAHNDPVTTTSGLTRYVMDIVATATPTVVVKTADLGKPTIGAVTPGKVTFGGLAALLQSLPDGSYNVVVKAEGPGGVSAGAMSDPFTVAKPKAPGAPGKPVLKQ